MQIRSRSRRLLAGLLGAAAIGALGALGAAPALAVVTFTDVPGRSTGDFIYTVDGDGNLYCSHLNFHQRQGKDTWTGETWLEAPSGFTWSEVDVRIGTGWPVGHALSVSKRVNGGNVYAISRGGTVVRGWLDAPYTNPGCKGMSWRGTADITPYRWSCTRSTWSRTCDYKSWFADTKFAFGVPYGDSFFQVTGGGHLYRYRNDCYNEHDGVSSDTCWKWEDTRGSGWNNFEHVFATSDPYARETVIYGIDTAGSLFWFKYLGAGQWANDGIGKVVGTGWGDVRTVFASDAGKIYVSFVSRGLSLYTHEGWSTGMGINDPGDNWHHAEIPLSHYVSGQFPDWQSVFPH